jgi:hypothetical protein
MRPDGPPGPARYLPSRGKEKIEREALMDELIERIDAAGQQVALTDFFDPWVDAVVNASNIYSPS